MQMTRSISGNEVPVGILTALDRFGMADFSDHRHVQTPQVPPSFAQCLRDEQFFACPARVAHALTGSSGPGRKGGLEVEYGCLGGCAGGGLRPLTADSETPRLEPSRTPRLRCRSRSATSSDRAMLTDPLLAREPRRRHQRWHRRGIGSAMRKSSVLTANANSTARSVTD